ncbi:MAG: aquaporin [Clostridiales bacterium]|nr:aquaporin [Clostridiales bacterium]
MKTFKKLLAEFFGTLFLVFFACGIASVACAGAEGALLNFVIAVGFGLALIACIYTIGYVSGSHVNPAVSLAMLIDGRMKFGEFIGYVIAQFLGAFAGAALLAALAGKDCGLATNLLADGVTPVAGIIIEAILTCMFVYTVMSTTAQKDFHGAGIVNGFALALVHILGVSFTGTSVNPARTFGPAIMKAIQGHPEALAQYWIFVVGPLAGAIIAAVLYRIINRCKCDKE